jgi:hypothetical protein
MTEAEWLACTDPQQMLKNLPGEASERKLRLFACACCRRVWHKLKDERSRQAMIVAERYADGLATEAELDEARAAAWVAEGELSQVGPRGIRRRAALAAARAAERNKLQNAAFSANTAEAWIAALVAARAAGRTKARVADKIAALDASKGFQAALLRDTFGNPFRPVHLDPQWQTPAVKALAQVIYEENSFQDLPILADALEEAGCDNEEMLSHCRGPGLHARGCWALDLLLGKS